MLAHGLGSGLVGLGSALLLAAVLVPLAIRLAWRLGVVDRPIGDKIHARPTPLMGGTAIAAAFLLVATFFPTLQRPWDNPALGGLLTGCALAVLLGVADEVWHLPPRWHFVGQVTVVLLAILAHFPLVHEVSNPLLSVGGGKPASINLAAALGAGPATALSVVFTVFWITGMMNTVNFLDGLDGLAAGVCAIAALFLGLWAVVVIRVGYPPTHDNQNVVLPLILCGALVGFLMYNWSPARVFMGDSGSMFVGFALGALAIFGPVKLGTALLILIVPIVDVAWAIVRRLIGRRSFASGDKHHIYHRMLELGLSRRTVVL
ncbi:MAG: MraY family glycosyltransferase, partial [Chloroflexota bacterium]